MAHQDYHAEATRLLARASIPPRTMSQRRDDAIMLAAVMLEWANEIQSKGERQLQAQLARMMDDPRGKAFTTSMTDQCFRSSDVHRVADQLVYLIEKFGIPQFLSFGQRLAIRLFRWFGRLMPGLLVPAVRKILRKETARVILPGEPEALAEHMRRRRDEGVRVNLNHLGEAILGDAEAQRRLQTYLEDLSKPEVEYISVKVSTICSQINLLSWEHTLDLLSERLRRLYRAARDQVYIRADGIRVPKFVNLDMEEFSDLRLTTALLRRVLDEPEFEQLSAGVVLQAYLPDSYLLQQELTEWAMARVAAGGAPIKIRIVKGANLAMEQVTGAIHGWPQAPYTNKTEVDANFKRMVLFGMIPDHARAVHLGIGSHNLFDIAFALLLRAEHGLEDEISFEMLEGMADHLRRVVQAITGNILLYCPAARENEFQNAIGYLIRRLDENTAPRNFLRHAFGLEPGTEAWNEQVALFVQSIDDIETVSIESRRRQNRRLPPIQPSLESPFANEPDTDWSLPDNQAWLKEIVQEWAEKPPFEIPSSSDAVKKSIIDPSAPSQIRCHYGLATEKEVGAALTALQKRSWATLTVSERSKILWQVAQELRKSRADLMGAMLFTTGKVAAEADIEIQEAIDFVEYYRREAETLHAMQDVSWTPKGTVVVAPPWNFPCSIPVGGIAAALSAGNNVILKPSPEAVLVGYLVAQAFWAGGIPHDALQFITCEDDPVGSSLIRDPRVNAVILTGSTATARHLLTMRPGLHLLAETGGKNAIIVTRMADRDLAVKDIVQSAFGHSGQKCSACSLLICEAEVYDDLLFRRQLSDAASSWTVGPSWDLKTRINPLILPASGALERGLTQLEEGEQWLLCPQQDPINPQLWSPGIKLGVRPDSFMHRTELFGPVLAVMRAKDLDDAIALANATPYGLTSGLHSLDPREQERWIEGIEAGNLYINRGITGAIVQRQPFGGCKDSSFGPGAKAGGPNYLINLMNPSQESVSRSHPASLQAVPLPQEISEFLEWCESKISPGEQRDLWNASIVSYCYYWKQLFSQRHDVSRIQGQDNYYYYRPLTVLMRMQPKDSCLDIWRVCAAALICGANLEVSGDALTLQSACGFPNLKAVVESPEAFSKRAGSMTNTRVRLLKKPPEKLEKLLVDQAARVIVEPVQANGRLELLHALREVSLSIDYHRYGNQGEREGEPRSPLAQP